MSNDQAKKSKNTVSSKEVSVLYQNLGGKLYAFTEIDGQIFFGKVAIQQSTKDNSAEKSFKNSSSKNKSPW